MGDMVWVIAHSRGCGKLPGGGRRDGLGLAIEGVVLWNAGGSKGKEMLKLVMRGELLARQEAARGCIWHGGEGWAHVCTGMVA